MIGGGGVKGQRAKGGGGGWKVRVGSLNFCLYNERLARTHRDTHIHTET